ncbi:MAG TPA: hypothetical protein VHG28_21860 [Longimicrobiaceae bacterium]|nr:hypothetical protein [Longimicrobiaceae bacterium]
MISALAHARGAARRLLARDSAGEAYRALLEAAAGVSLEGGVVSTSEHIAPYNLASTVSFALPQLAVRGEEGNGRRTVVVFAGALVPLDNSHYPRGFYLPDAPPERRFNLFPQHRRKCAPLLLPPVRVPDLPGGAEFLRRFPWLDPLAAGEAAFPTYAHQMAACMEAMAGRWVPGGAERFRVLPLEEVARRMLVGLLENGDPVLDRLLFDAGTRERLLHGLHGVFCAWGDRRGSFLFWAARDGRLHRLWEEGGRLTDGSGGFPLDRAGVAAALSDGRLWPGVFLSLLAVSYLPGVPVAGGPKQLRYYRSMVRAVNSTGAASRDEELSVLGYMTTDVGRLRPGPGRPGRIPAHGTGLALAGAPLDAEWLREELDQVPAVLDPAPGVAL